MLDEALHAAKARRPRKDLRAPGDPHRFGSAARHLNRHHRAEAIVHAAERGRKLVEKILLLGRRNMAQRVSTNVGLLARETLDLANLTRPPNVRTSINIRTPNTILVVDPAQIHQAIMNLLINAAECAELLGLVEAAVTVCESRLGRA